MFAAYIRAALTLGVAVIVGIILELIVPFLLPFQGPQDSLLYQSFATVADNALLIMVIAVGFGLIVRAVVERSPGGGI